jgi:peptidoglycan/LPS O-acetylase OafA/YrhL
MALGTLGVDGFFLLSGYLIVKSWLSKPNLLDFAVKRFLRIGPGYAVAVIVGTLVVGLVAPGTDHFFRKLDWHWLLSIVFLFRPAATPPVFPGNFLPVVNSSLWTILYEFRCYAFVALFGTLNILRPRVWLVMTGILLALVMVPSLAAHLPWPTIFYQFLGDPANVLRLTPLFFVGGCFALYRVSFLPVLGCVAVLGLVVTTVLFPHHLETGLMVFGGYLLFYFTRRPMASLAWMGRVPDLSYGVYLYGFPVESLLIWKFHSAPWVIFVESAAICFVLAWMSWTFVEEPALSLIRRPSSAVLKFTTNNKTNNSLDCGSQIFQCTALESSRTVPQSPRRVSLRRFLR